MCMEVTKHLAELYADIEYLRNRQYFLFGPIEMLGQRFAFDEIHD